MATFPALAPLPSLRPKEAMDSLRMETEGFVDEEIVRALICGPQVARAIARPADLALSSGDEDFAGWHAPLAAIVDDIPPAPPRTVQTRLIEEKPEPPHSNRHRRWVAATAAILSTLSLACLLLVLSRRPAADAAIPSTKPEATEHSAAPGEPAGLPASIR